MTKTYKITYKTYFNTRLKPVGYNGEATHPLYSQITYARQTLYFKSAMFELLSQERYAIRQGKKKDLPNIEFIVEKENQLLEFVAEKCRAKFTPELFKLNYTYYGTDLCTSTEEAFRVFLFSFLSEKGMPNFARALTDGSTKYILYDILQDAKKIFTPPAYLDLTSTLSKAPPYMELYSFVRDQKKWPDKSLTIMEWEQQETKDAFLLYLEKYPAEQVKLILQKIEKWLGYVVRSARTELKNK